MLPPRRAALEARAVELQFESPWFGHVRAYGDETYAVLLLQNGEGGIRTLGTLLGYGALAKRCFRPLSHLTKKSKISATVINRRYKKNSTQYGMDADCVNGRRE